VALNQLINVAVAEKVSLCVPRRIFGQIEVRNRPKSLECGQSGDP
jgi:hypothetical protein